MWVCTEIAIGIAAAAAAGELLDEDETGGQVAAGPAPALGVVEAEEPELAAAPEDVVGEEPGVLPLVDVGPQLLVDVAADRLAQLVVLGGEDRVGGHGAHSGPVRACPSASCPVDCRP